METLLIGLGVVILALVVMYNTLISKKNQVDNIFAGLDVVLKKRYDLIPNLIAMLQEYMSHEKSTLETLTYLRSQAMQGPLNYHEKNILENKISSLLGSVMVAAENYPNLKANENFLHVQHTLNEIEEQISAARRAYNQSVTDYNNALEMFPTNMMASAMRLEKKTVISITEGERQNVNVKTLFQ